MVFSGRSDNYVNKGQAVSKREEPKKFQGV